MSKRISSRRQLLKAGAAIAGATVVADTAIAQAPSITGGVESSFPSADAPGSNDGGYNVLFILTDQEQYMGPGWPVPLPGHERLRRTGTYFENHHIAADMCSASRLLRLHRHRRLHRRRVGRLPVRPDHFRSGGAVAEGQRAADDRPPPALVPGGQSRQST
jgi:hypothetical protein